MSEKLIKRFEETFKDLTKITPEKLQGLLEETLLVFTDIQARSKSEDKDIREEAFKMAQEIRGSLEKQQEVLCKNLGIDLDQMKALIEDSKNFSKEEREIVGLAEEGLSQFQDKLTDLKKDLLNVKPKKHKVREKTWLMG